MKAQAEATAEEAAATEEAAVEEPVHIPISNTTGHVTYNAMSLSELQHVARRRRMPDVSKDKATLVQVLEWTDLDIQHATRKAECAARKMRRQDQARDMRRNTGTVELAHLRTRPLMYFVICVRPRGTLISGPVQNAASGTHVLRLNVQLVGRVLATHKQ